MAIPKLEDLSAERFIRMACENEQIGKDDYEKILEKMFSRKSGKIQDIPCKEINIRVVDKSSKLTDLMAKIISFINGRRD
jgi:hypothetical protein